MAFGAKVLRVPVRLSGGRGYDVEIGAGALSRLGAVARARLPKEARKVALVSNRRVFALYGERAVASLRAVGFEVAHWLMGEGERFKTFRTAERALGFLSDFGLERSDCVVALGGGVVGDLAGFAAALHLRGVAFIQAPTTLLAQIDSSVGGKTGVNTSAGKNLVGAFHQPAAVVVDTETLGTLPPRELTAGWCEAVKQGAVGDRRLFERTKRFLTGRRAGAVAVRPAPSSWSPTRGARGNWRASSPRSARLRRGSWRRTSARTWAARAPSRGACSTSGTRSGTRSNPSPRTGASGTARPSATACSRPRRFLKGWNSWARRS
ncbi:MAG TPA: 3-dehydroquinate synthase family protein [Pyrinomonadaceae bacterium]|nr:3-dehydroquinate synthase family protein [Pyrinomonadaceae bacterium]